jgi:hypothetical protein
MGGRFWQRDRVARRMARVGEELAVEVVDPRPRLRDALSAGRDPYFRDGLWTAAGHAAAAEALVPAVARLACPVPAEPSPPPPFVDRPARMH